MDLKALGYLVSTVSVLLLGAVAWPKPEDPRWHGLAVVAGVVISIGGMGLRWLSHRKQKKELARTEAEARGR